MELNFELNSKDVYDQDLAEKFCEALVDSIKTDIRNSIPPAKYPVLEKLLINAKWIRWKTEPKHINVSRLIDLILDCIEWRKRKYSYQVYIKTNVLMPNTVGTTLEQVARFIDKGNEITTQNMMLSRIFNDYERNIKKHWEAYKYLGSALDNREVQ